MRIQNTRFCESTAERNDIVLGQIGIGERQLDVVGLNIDDTRIDQAKGRFVDGPQVIDQSRLDRISMLWRVA